MGRAALLTRLPVLATSPTAVINLRIVSHHRDIGKSLRTISYDVDIFYRLRQFAIFYQEAIGNIKRKIPGSYLDLPIREAARINSPFDG